MNRKTVFRNVALVAAILIGLFVWQYLSDDTRGWSQVDTSVALQQLKTQNVIEAQIDDREQDLRLKLKSGIDVDSTKGTSRSSRNIPMTRRVRHLHDGPGIGAEKFNTIVTRRQCLSSVVMFVLPMVASSRCSSS